MENLKTVILYCTDFQKLYSTVIQEWCSTVIQDCFPKSLKILFQSHSEILFRSCYSKVCCKPPFSKVPNFLGPLVEENQVSKS